MPTIFWDASALAKRFVYEKGTDVVAELFASVPQPQMVGTILGYAETFSTVVRHRNRGNLSNATFRAAKDRLRFELIDDPDFELLSLDDSAILAGIPLMERYSINSTDAAILTLFLRYIDTLPPGSPPCLLVAADRALVSAARAEGFQAIDPETVSVADMRAILASL